MIAEDEAGLKSGSSYLFTGRGVVRAYEALKRLSAQGRRAIVISRAHPNRVKQLHSVDCPIMWIAKNTNPASGVTSLEPTRLMKIHGTISDFIKANPGSVVLEYLITENGCGAVMKTIQLTNEEIAMTGSFLLVPVDPRTLETQQLGYLEREFSLTKEHSSQ